MSVDIFSVLTLDAFVLVVPLSLFCNFPVLSQCEILLFFISSAIFFSVLLLLLF